MQSLTNNKRKVIDVGGIRLDCDSEEEEDNLSPRKLPSKKQSVKTSKRNSVAPSAKVDEEKADSNNENTDAEKQPEIVSE